MRLQEIIQIIKQNLFLGITGVIILGVIFWIGYFLIYKKKLNGKGNLPKRQFFVYALFACYIIMIIGVTFLNRGTNSETHFNFHFLSSYIEAWNIFSVRNWQFIIFNILMFVPFGILLPLIHRRFHQFQWTIGVGLLFTLFIECVQLVTGFGIFDLDDLFNNILGTIMGFDILKGIWLLRKGQQKRFLATAGYFTPLFLVIILFVGIFSFYHFKEFGNLAIAPNYRINMKDIAPALNIELSKDRKSVPIYQAPTFTKDSAKKFAMDFYQKLNIDMKTMEVIAYPDCAFYKAGNYHITVNYVGKSYTYSFLDPSMAREGVEPANVNEVLLLKNLNHFGITIPDGAKLNKVDRRYEWQVDKKAIGNDLINGVLSCSCSKDGTIMNVNNHLVVYHKVKNIPIKSEQEAYQELMEGKFQIYLNERIQTMKILRIHLDYNLDSKGFYQPVYIFDCKVNGKDMPITIPAM